MENMDETTQVAATGSIQKSDDDVDLTSGVSTKFRLTLEPIMVLLLVGTNISMLVQTNEFEVRTCFHSKLGQNKSVNCFNMTSAEQEQIQPSVASLMMYKNLIETLLPCVITLFLGPWSDVNGRLPLILISISGSIVYNCMFCVFSTIPALPPVSFLLCSIPVAISGGNSAIYLASFCYINDITNQKTRAFRMSVLQTSIALGSIIGLLISPFVYTKSYTYAFGLTTIFTILALLYASIFLKETVVIKKNANTKLFNLDLIKDMWKTVVKKRFGFLRSIILLSAVVLTLNIIILLGEDPLMYLYLQKRFLWSLDDYTLFNMYSTLLSACLPTVGLYFLSTKLGVPDMYLATIATGFRIIEKIGLAFAEHRWQFYFVKVFGSVVLTSEPLVRSQLSKSFPVEDLGKIYAFVSAIEGFGVILGSPLYTTAYNLTIHGFSNFIFFLSSMIGTLALALYISMTVLLARSVQTENLLIEH